MGKEMREQINKIRNFNQFLDENKNSELENAYNLFKSKKLNYELEDNLDDAYKH